MGCNFAFLIRVDFSRVEPSIGRVEGMFDSSERNWDNPTALELTAQVTGSDLSVLSNDRTIGLTSEEEFTRNMPVPIHKDGREWRIPPYPLSSASSAGPSAASEVSPAEAHVQVEAAVMAGCKLIGVVPGAKVSQAPSAET